MTLTNFGTVRSHSSRRSFARGLLVYATCSTSEEENEAVVENFLTQRHDFMLENGRDLFPGAAELFTERGMFRSWPHRHGMDGFCAARLRKTNQ